MLKRKKVAPPAGAWIETVAGRSRILGLNVAPPAGAWIETFRIAFIIAYSAGVAPPAGAWIETRKYPSLIIIAGRSRPPRARGLKQLYNSIFSGIIQSRPPRARGLKLFFLLLKITLYFVAPPAGAWIET